MLGQFGHLLAQACHMIGLVMMVIGGLMIGLALLGGSGPTGLIRGGVLLLFGAWFSGLAG